MENYLLRLVTFQVPNCISNQRNDTCAAAFLKKKILARKTYFQTLLFDTEQLSVYFTLCLLHTINPVLC